jgi:hypothetical protein
MTLAFWNGGSPKRISSPRVVQLPNGNVIFGAAVDPAQDIYNYVVVGDRPANHQRQGSVSHDLAGDTITTTYINIDRDLAQVTDRVVADIDAMAADVAYGGMIHLGQDVATDTLSVDTMTLVASAISDGETLPAGFSWENMQGVRFNLGDVQFAGLRNAAAQHFVQARKQAADHKDAVEALLSVADVVAYDYSTGWPANPVPAP